MRCSGAKALFPRVEKDRPPILLGLLVLFTQLGCVVKYTPPPTSPSASLTLACSNEEGVRVQAYADAKCAKAPHGTRLAYFWLGFYDDPAGVERTIEVTGKEFVFTYAPIYPPRCQVTVGFVPKAGKRYRALYEKTRDGCDVSLTRLEIDPQGHQIAVLEETARDIRPACVSNFTD